jgi:hypothetical protein
MPGRASGWSPDGPKHCSGLQRAADPRIKKLQKSAGDRRGGAISQTRLFHTLDVYLSAICHEGGALIDPRSIA